MWLHSNVPMTRNHVDVFISNHIIISFSTIVMRIEDKRIVTMNRYNEL